MKIELVVPDSWTPGQSLAMRALLQKVIGTGYPIIACVRSDATPDQIQHVNGQVQALIREAGLAI